MTVLYASVQYNFIQVLFGYKCNILTLPSHNKPSVYLYLVYLLSVGDASHTRSGPPIRLHNGSNSSSLDIYIYI